MISVDYSCDDTVLDLCVRKAEKRCASPKSFTPYVPQSKRSRSGSPSSGLDLCSVGSEDVHDYRTVFPDYSATVAVLHDRLFEGERDTMSAERASVPPSPNYASFSPQATTSTILKGKATRPFKAYPKNPLSLVSPVEGILADSSEDYATFRRKMLEQVHAATGGHGGNKNMKRPVNSVSPTNQQPSSSMDNGKDQAYWERRRKNNEAAKRSRDARRAKEDELAIRAAYLEQENVKLRYEVAALRNEAQRLRCMMQFGNDRRV